MLAITDVEEELHLCAYCLQLKRYPSSSLFIPHSTFTLNCVVVRAIPLTSKKLRDTDSRHGQSKVHFAVRHYNNNRIEFNVITFLPRWCRPGVISHFVLLFTATELLKKKKKYMLS